MNDFGAQAKFFEELRSRFSRKGDLVRALSDLLNLSPSSVYRRMNGEQLLSMDELVFLARRYAISLDTITNSPDGPIPFNHSPLTDSDHSFDAFVHFIYRQLRNLPSGQPTSLLIASQDLPSLLYFGHPNLLAFKKYIYGLGFQSNGQQSAPDFQPRRLPHSVADQARACADLYRSVSSTDIWGLNMLDTTLRQIEYVAAAGRFAHRQDAYALCDHLQEIVETAREMASRGHKPGKGRTKPSFALYVNDLVFTANIILARSDNHFRLLTSLGAPSALACRHQDLGSHLENWFERLIQNSASISVHDDKTRKAYFNRFRDKIDETRKNLFR